MRFSGLRAPLIVASLCATLIVPLLAGRHAEAQGTPLRLSVNKWKVDPGDSYTLSWMESGSVQTISEFTIEENADAQFRDKESYSRYVVRSHSKSFENSTAYSHTVRYYRVRARAWVRNSDESQVEDEVVSNIVRVTLLGTDKSAPPSFPDDPEDAPRKSKKDKDKDKDKDKKKEDDYPAMGRPDFVITKLSTEPPTPVEGRPFRVKATVRNAGVSPSAAVQIRLEAAGRQFIVECDPLKPAYRSEVTSPPILPEKAGPMTVSAEADPFQRGDESREDNNLRTETVIVEAAPAEASPSTSPSGAPSAAPSPGTSGTDKATR